MRFLLLIPVILFSRCAAPGQTSPAVPVITILGVSVDRAGFVLPAEDKDYLISKGVQPLWFEPYVEPTYWSRANVATPTPANSFYIDRLAEIQAADMLRAKRNPLPAIAPSTNAAAGKKP